MAGTAAFSLQPTFAKQAFNISSEWDFTVHPPHPFWGFITGKLFLLSNTWAQPSTAFHLSHYQKVFQPGLNLSRVHPANSNAVPSEITLTTAIMEMRSLLHLTYWKQNQWTYGNVLTDTHSSTYRMYWKIKVDPLVEIRHTFERIHGSEAEGRLSCPSTKRLFLFS